MPDQRRVRPLGRVMIGLCAAAWLLALAATVLTVIGFASGELEGMAVLSGIVIIVIALAVALLITGVTLVYLYVSRRRRVT